MQSKKIFKQWVLLGTGGTIAGTASSASDLTGYTAGQVAVQDLLRSVPGLQEALQGDALHCEQVAQLDSKDMDHATWQTLALRCQHWLAQPEVDGLLITHGTDTLEETAWFLQQVLDTHKPVVLTCAMRPASAWQPDGPHNLRAAIAVLRDAAAQGVLVVCAGQIHSARHVQKVHTARLDAFASGDAGPCGEVLGLPQLDQAPPASAAQTAATTPSAPAPSALTVRWTPAPPPPAPPPHPHAPRLLALPVADWPWVEVLHNHAGVDARKVAWGQAAGVQGWVVAGTGNGTLNHQLLQALLQAQQQGAAVRLCTRCNQGQISGHTALLRAAPEGVNAYKARISLMLDLVG